MADSLIEKIGRPLDHPPDYHVLIAPGGDREPVRVFIPKDRVTNLRWRREIYSRCANNLDAQRTQMTLCASPTPEGCLYWLNAFGWTFLQMKMKGDKNVAVLADDAVVPFITWPVQDDIVAQLVKSILTGQNVVVDKTRDMGMSWLILAVFTWMYLFTRNVNFMVMSRVEELVWNAEDPDSLLWKVDFLVNQCPEWMRPPANKKNAGMRRFNPRTRSSIVGKSTSAQQGRAGRKTAVLLDEAAAMQSLKSIWVSMAHTTSCIIANSTPLGPGFFAKLVRNPKGKLIRAPFWDHPDKGRGRYERVNPSTGEIEIRSPWLDRLEAEADDPMVVSQEVLMDHQGAGFIVFPARAIQRQELHCRPPLSVGVIRHVGTKLLDTDIRERRVRAFDFVEDGAETPLKLWIDLEEDHAGLWRPPQLRTYAMGIDVSLGQGRSNSTICVVDVETGEQVAEYADARVGPEEFARIASMLGLWFGGVRGCAFMIWEDNGGGGTFRIALRKLAYPWLYFNIDETRRSRKKSDKYGWHSNDTAKKDLLGHLAAGWLRDEMVMRSEACVREAADYIFYDSGGVGPGELAQESPVATKTHGDRVIAAMLAYYARGMAHRCSPPPRVAPVGSPADRRERAAKRGLRVAEQLPQWKQGRAVIPRGFTESRLFGSR